VTTGRESIEIIATGDRRELSLAATIFAKEKGGRMTSIRPLTERDDGVYEEYRCEHGKLIKCSH
jgi:hypothetical protein